MLRVTLNSVLLAALLPFAQIAYGYDYHIVKKDNISFFDTINAAVNYVLAPQIVDEDAINGKYIVVKTDSAKYDERKFGQNKDIFDLQIRTCKQQKLENCPIFPRRAHGAALIMNGTDIYTCRHVVNNWSSAAAAQNGKYYSQITPAMIIISNDGNEIYNSGSGSVKMKVTVANDDSRLRVTLPRSYVDMPDAMKKLLAFSDFEQLKTDTPITKEVKLDSADPVDGMKVLGFGYPDGDVLSYAEGQVVDVFSDWNTLRTSYPVVGGMSGGAVVDLTGKVVGVNCFSEVGNTSVVKTLDVQNYPAIFRALQDLKIE